MMTKWPCKLNVLRCFIALLVLLHLCSTINGNEIGSFLVDKGWQSVLADTADSDSPQRAEPKTFFVAHPHPPQPLGLQPAPSFRVGLQAPPPPWDRAVRSTGPPASDTSVARG